MAPCLPRRAPNWKRSRVIYGVGGMTESIVIEPRFRGPARFPNGGYTCGLVAGLLDADTAGVTLRLPPPLDTPLLVERLDDAVRDRS